MMKVNKKKIRVHSLTGRITDEIMLKAFKSVKKNRGAAGIDKQSIQMYEGNLSQNLAALMKEIKTGSYQPIPLRRKYIPKGSGKFRPLGIPTVRCRIAQEVIRMIINPIFERNFHNSSHGFRRHRSCHTAIKELLQYHKEGYKVVVDADIKGFFDNIPHKLIMAMVEREISDGNILNTVKKFLRSGVMEEGQIKLTRKGTPQGGVISPLLANIVLNHLDWVLERHGYKFVRYADDFVVLSKSRDKAEKSLEVISHCIEEDLGLELHEEKTVITDFKQGFEFLGFYISSGTIRMKPEAKDKFKNKIREITRRTNNLDKRVIERLNYTIRGTVNYFFTPFSTNLKQFTELDEWIRKRIRCMKYKRIWRTDSRRLKNKHIYNMGLLSCRELCLSR